MTPKAKLFQAGFSALLAIAFLVLASPTRAEPVTLSCRDDAKSHTITLRVNYTTGLVEQLAPSGNAYTNRVATATISPNAIIWLNQTTEHWEGRIDRLSGTGWSQWARLSSGGGHGPVEEDLTFTCRQATKPKF
jgi:hypothetical protein